MMGINYKKISKKTRRDKKSKNKMDARICSAGKGAQMRFDVTANIELY